MTILPAALTFLAFIVLFPIAMNFIIGSRARKP